MTKHHAELGHAPGVIKSKGLGQWRSAAVAVQPGLSDRQLAQIERAADDLRDDSEMTHQGLRKTPWACAVFRSAPR